MSLLETISLREQDTRVVVHQKLNRRKQKTGIKALARSPGFSRIYGDSMYSTHMIFQVPTPAKTGGGRYVFAGFQA